MAEGSQPNVTGLVLAGGLSRRFDGEDKAWQVFRGRPLVEHAMDLLADLDDIVISANRDLSQFARYGHRVIADRRPGLLGPLSGIETALLETGADALLVVPCDVIGSPFDWASQLVAHADRVGSPWAGTRDGERLQPLLAYWSAALLPDISRALDEDNLRVMRLIAPWEQNALALPEEHHLLNLNTPEALARANA